MALYQRRDLETNEDIGEPGPLPADLVGGLTDADLEVLGTLGPAPHYVGQGFFRMADPEPEPSPRWLHKAIVLQRIPAAKRIAVRTAAQANPIIEDFLDLLRQTDQVDLDNANLVAGFGYLVQQGLLTAEDVAAVRA